MTTLEAREIDEIGEEREVRITELLGPVRRRWRVVVLCAGVCGFLAAVISLILPSVYTAQTTFTPVASSQSLSGGLANLMGLAGELGLSSITGGGNLPPEYFAEVLHSRSILESTLESQFPTSRDSAAPRRMLLDILEIKGKTPRGRIEDGVKELDDHILASVDKRTGVVNLRVKARSPVVAAAVANRMVELLDEFNQNRSQFQSREQRRFTGERMRQAQGELQGAEAAMLQFLQANREYRGSPLLEYQWSKLQRDVQVKQEVYLSLAKAYDEARIAEARDIPVLTIIDNAVPPTRRSFPRRTLNTLLGMIVGGLIGLAITFVADRRSILRARG